MGVVLRPGRGVDSQALRGEAVLRLLRRLGPDGLVVAMEDLHWADPDTVSLVEYLADNAVGQPLLFAVSLRSELPGSWVQFPARVPHTFRVLGGPARVLMVHADDSFLAAVREIGRPATGSDVPEAVQGPTMEELDRAFAAHGITNVGPPMEQGEAERMLGELAGTAIPD